MATANPTLGVCEATKTAVREGIARAIGRQLDTLDAKSDEPSTFFFHVNNKHIHSAGADPTGRPYDPDHAVTLLTHAEWKLHLVTSLKSAVACKGCLLPDEASWTTIAHDLLPGERVAVIRYWAFEFAETLQVSEQMVKEITTDPRAQLIPFALTGHTFPVPYIRVAAQVTCFSSIDTMTIADDDDAVESLRRDAQELSVSSAAQAIEPTEPLVTTPPLTPSKDGDEMDLDEHGDVVTKWVHHPTQQQRDRAHELYLRAHRSKQAGESVETINGLLEEALSLLVNGVETPCPFDVSRIDRPQDSLEDSARDVVELPSSPVCRRRYGASSAPQQRVSPTLCTETHMRNVVQDLASEWRSHELDSVEVVTNRVLDATVDATTPINKGDCDDSGTKTHTAFSDS